MANETANMCVVCCRKITIFAVGECEHPVCHECSTRMRVLCNQTDCPICRQNMPQVFFTTKCCKYDEAKMCIASSDRHRGLFFETSDIEEAYYKLLEFGCNECKTYTKFGNFNELKLHMRNSHERYYCDLCIKNVKLFSHERKVYLRTELARHRRIGDPDDTSHRGHPLCEFCSERYMDQDELFRHLRKDHFYCHFCDADGHHVFYSEYNDLREHFSTRHFLCEEGSCKNEEFTSVFRSDIDLKAHKAVTHSRNLTKAQAKQTRTLDVEFTLTPRNDPHRSHEEFYASADQTDAVNTRLRNDGNSHRKKTFTKSKELAVAAAVPPHPPPPVDEIPETKDCVLDMCQDFPSLDGSVGTANQTLNPVWRSSLKRMADPTGGNNEDMFPSLVSNAPHNWLNKTQVTIPKKPTRITALKPSPQTAPKPPLQTAPQPRKTLSIKSEDDFPSLPKQPTTNLFTADRFVHIDSHNTVSPNLSIVVKAPSKPVLSAARGNAGIVLTKDDFPQLPNKTSGSGEKFRNAHNGKENGERKWGKSCEPKHSLKTVLNIPAVSKDVEKSDHLNLSEVADSLKIDVEKKKNGGKKTGAGNEATNETTNANVTTITNPPPGIVIAELSNLKNSEKNRHSTDDNSFANNFPPRTYAYLEPTNFKNRNYALITKIKNLMNNDAGLFLEFRTLSGQYRQQVVSASIYCESCIRLIGDEGFLEVFPELIMLLPDIQKQKELLVAYNASKAILNSKLGAKSNSKIQILSCAVCQQVLSVEDLTFHMIMHK